MRGRKRKKKKKEDLLIGWGCACRGAGIRMASLVCGHGCVVCMWMSIKERKRKRKKECTLLVGMVDALACGHVACECVGVQTRMLVVGVHECKKRKRKLLNGWWMVDVDSGACGWQWVQMAVDADGGECGWWWMQMAVNADGGGCRWWWMRMVVDAVTDTDVAESARVQDLDNFVQVSAATTHY